MPPRRREIPQLTAEEAEEMRSSRDTVPAEAKSRSGVDKIPPDPENANEERKLAHRRQKDEGERDEELSKAEKAAKRAQPELRQRRQRSGRDLPQTGD